MKDAVEKGRQAKGEILASKRRGEDAPMSKLKKSDVLQIRERRGNGERVVDLAKEFNVCCDNIFHIVKRKTWSHI